MAGPLQLHESSLKSNIGDTPSNSNKPAQPMRAMPYDWHTNCPSQPTHQKWQQTISNSKLKKQNHPSGSYWETQKEEPNGWKTWPEHKQQSMDVNAYATSSGLKNNTELPGKSNVQTRHIDKPEG